MTDPRIAAAAIAAVAIAQTASLSSDYDDRGQRFYARLAAASADHTG